MRTLDQLLEAVKAHPRFAEVGMVLFHNGVVRSTSRDGQPVTGMSVQADHKQLQKIIDEAHNLPGIKAVLVEINEGSLTIGQDVMRVVVAGDIRDNVFPALEKIINRIKKEVISKKEYFV